jgi:glycosyltransferase involved in cell wall biosynthesis
MRQDQMADTGKPIMIASKRKIRVAVDARPALWPKTGIGVIAREFIAKIGLSIDDVEFTLFFDKEPTEQYVREVPCKKRWSNINNRFLWTHLFLSNQLRSSKFDVFLTFLERDIPLISFGTKSIVLICDVIPLRMSQMYLPSILRYMFYRLSIRYSLFKADSVLTISEFSKTDLINFFEAPPKSVSVIPLGSSVSNCQNYCQTRRDESKYILLMGSTEPRKNNVMVLEAFQRMRNDFPDLSIIIIGKPWRGIEFPRRLLEGKVIQAGFVADEDIFELMMNAEIFCFPSHCEGFGLPVLDAMTLGVPVITASGSAIAEVAGDAALYVNPNESGEIEQKLRTLLEDDELKASLIVEGARQASLFTWEKMYFAVKAKIQSLVLER